MPFAFHYAARSDVGMVRSENQDSGYAGPRLLAMADGMGGHAGGDIASSTVIGALVDLDGEALGSSEASSALLQRITAANDQLADIAKAEPALHGMGTTLIAILRSHNKLVLAHIGTAGGPPVPPINLIADFGAVDYTSSAGLRVLLGTVKRARSGPAGER